MSADNGVYILRTNDKPRQYRVSTFQAIDNLYYNEFEPHKEVLNSLQVLIQYGSTKYTMSYNTAMRIAGNILRKLPICEYGIQIIDANKTWKELCDEAREEAEEYILHGIKGYDIKRLNKIARGEFDSL